MRGSSNKGIIFENEVAEKLKGMGFVHVKVTKRSREYGADILAFKNGLEYVIQCKKYERPVGFKGVQEVSTAMEIYKADVGFLVCDTRFTKDAYKAVKEIDKPIELVGLEEIRAWKIKKVKPIKYRRHPYQKKILSKIIKHRKKGNSSALLVMATGLGKTLVAAWDLKNQIRRGEKALFLVHRKDILVENSEKFHAIISEKRKNYEFGVYFSGKKFKKEDIVFSTFQTIIKHYKKIPKKYFDYIIIDEAHHSPAKTYAEVLKYFQPKFILGITATPKRITKSDNEFVENVFGKSLVDLDLAEALTKGYLCPVKYSVFCDNIDYGKLKSVNKKLSIEQLNQTYFIPTKDEDIERIIYGEINRIKRPRTIIFCPTINYINSVKSIGLFKDAEIYHSNMSDFQRDLIFRRFKIGKINTILVRDLLNEGIDIPDANIVVFLRTTYSPTIFFQQLGRGLRKDKRKKHLRVLDFVGALSNIEKVINVFGHLLIIQDFVEKVEKQKKLSNIYLGKTYKANGLLEPLELDFYQAGRAVKHRETKFKEKDFLSVVKSLKKRLWKSGGWTEEEIKDELKPLCEELGQFPPTPFLEKRGRRDLIDQMKKYGGVYYFAKKLGYKTSQKPKGHWDKFENIEKEILPICEQLGEMPSRGYLQEIGKADLEAAINAKYGGLPQLAIKLGYKAKRKPKGYWEKWENIERKLSPICKKLGKMPTSVYLRKNGQADLEAAIFEKWGGMSQVTKKLGYSIMKRLNKYWEKWENLEKELRPICKQLGEMPSRGYLQEIGKSYLDSIIPKWGGYPQVAKRLGYSTYQRPKGYWDDEENIKKELLPICEQLGKMPTGDYLREIRKGYLESAIYKKWGGIPQAAKELGLETRYKPRGYYDIWENIEKELLPICKELGKMPNAKYLREIGKGDLQVAISKRWSGFFRVAKKLGYKTQKKPKGYWNKWENIKIELLPICKQLGKMPTASYLRKNKMNDLYKAIFMKWGGINKVKKRLGYN